MMDLFGDEVPIKTKKNSKKNETDSEEKIVVKYDFSDYRHTEDAVTVLTKYREAMQSDMESYDKQIKHNREAFRGKMKEIAKGNLKAEQIIERKVIEVKVEDVEPDIDENIEIEAIQFSPNEIKADVFFEELRLAAEKQGFSKKLAIKLFQRKPILSYEKPKHYVERVLSSYIDEQKNEMTLAKRFFDLTYTTKVISNEINQTDKWGALIDKSEVLSNADKKFLLHSQIVSSQNDHVLLSLPQDYFNEIREDFQFLTRVANFMSNVSKRNISVQFTNAETEKSPYALRQAKFDEIKAKAFSEIQKSPEFELLQDVFGVTIDKDIFTLNPPKEEFL